MSRHSLLGGHNDGCSGEHGILAEVWKCSVPPLSMHHQVNFIGGGHVVPGTHPNVSGGQLRIDVLTKDVGG